MTIEDRPHLKEVLVKSSNPDVRRLRVKDGLAIIFYPKAADRTALVVVDADNPVGLSTGRHAALEIAAQRYMGPDQATFLAEFYLVRGHIVPNQPRGRERTFVAVGMSSLDSKRFPGAEYTQPDTLFANPADRVLVLDVLNTYGRRRNPITAFRVQTDISSDQQIGQANAQLLASGGLDALKHRLDVNQPDHLRRVSD